MKKLKLNELNLGNAEVLTREELKKVLGGMGSGSGGTNCTDSCETDSDCNGGSENSCNKCSQSSIMYHKCVTSVS